MCLLRKVVTYLSIFLLSVPVFSQTSYPKTLLWRISGNGLQKPSYLFGTMHLNDKRLFRFADSVYGAIEKSDGLAIELNPDEMAAFYVTKMFDELEKGKKLSTVLNDKDFKKYSKALSKKFNKPADEITTKDIVQEKNKWMAEYLEKGEMPTFVDAYLYNIARRQGKWMGGVEDVTDQEGLDELIDKSDIDYLLAGDKSVVDAGLDKMINLYINQDLDGIEAMSNAQSKEEKDLLLIKRNSKMARRIDSLANVRTMFFAIGAAHLPGTQGVISLLKSQGFTIEPVLSDKKIEPQDYKVKEVPVKWTDIKDANDLYTAKMPGNPTPVKLYGLVEMKFLLDIFSLSGYCTAAMISPSELETPDSLFSAMVKGMFPGKKNIISKKIDKDGVAGREYQESREGETMRVQLLMYKKVVYMVMMYSSKKETLTSPDADKFFSSFTINKSPIQKISSYEFTDSIMGISLISPTQITYNEKLSNDKDESWKVSGFGGTDIANGIYIMLFSKEVKPGRYIVNDSIINDNLYKGMQKQYPDIKMENINIQGYPATMFYGINEEQKNIAAKIINTIKGNRNILLMVISDTTHMKSPEVENIFSSFKFIENKSPEWKLNTSPDKSFSAWSPSAFRKNESKTFSNLNETQYISYDTSTATTYSVTADTLGKYYWATADSTFWNERRHVWYTDKDTLLISQKIQNDGLQGTEILIRKEGVSNVFQRIRILLDGDKIYTLYSSSQKEQLYNNHAEQFFSGFKLTSPAKQTDIFQSKAKILLNDLNAEDSATRSKSGQALYDANFTAIDLPLLHEALFKEYRSLYDSSKSTYINTRIANHLESLAQSSTVTFIKEKYETLTPSLSVVALSTLAGIHTTESYKILGELLNYPTVKGVPEYRLESNLKDSLALTAKIFPSLITLAKDSMYGPVVAGVLLSLIDSGFIKQEVVAEYEKDFIAITEALLPELKTKGSNADYSTYDLIELLARLNTNSSINILKKYQYISDNYLKKTVVMHLLKKGFKAEPTAINSIAADMGVRTGFYNELKDIKKQSLFPVQFLTQKAFAESAVYSAAQDDDEDNDIRPAVTFISEKIASCKGKKYKFYLFKLSYGTGKDAASYLGIAGGYALTGNSLEEKENFSGVFWNNEFKASGVNEDFNAYLNQFEKEESDTEEEE